MERCLKRQIGPRLHSYPGFKWAYYCIHGSTNSSTSIAVDAARAFEIALEIGINQDVLEGDSEMVIHALANEAPYWSIFGNFIENARFFFFFKFFF